MAHSIHWHGQTKILKPPNADDRDRIHDICIFNNGNVSVSCWQLTPEELADIIQNGGKVYLAVLYGPSQPPCFVGSEDSIRSTVIDYGRVWKKLSGPVNNV